MARKIVVEACTKCPYCKLSGGFGLVRYIPRCTGVEGPSKELPYKLITSPTNPSGVYAEGAGVIPDWCPLPKDGE